MITTVTALIEVYEAGYLRKVTYNLNISKPKKQPNQVKVKCPFISTSQTHHQVKKINLMQSFIPTITSGKQSGRHLKVAKDQNTYLNLGIHSLTKIKPFSSHVSSLFLKRSHSRLISLINLKRIT